MKDINRLDLYKEIYNNQKDEYNEIQNKLLLHFAALILLALNINHLFNFNVKNKSQLNLSIFFFILFSHFFLKTLILYYKSWKSHEYWYIKSCSSIEKDYKNEEEFFYSNILEEFIEDNDHNYEIIKEVEELKTKIKLNSLFLLFIVFIYNFLIVLIKI